MPVFACTSYEPHETLVETGNAHHPTRTRTLWGDRCLDAVACQGYRLIWPARMLFLEGLEVYSIGGRPAEGMLCLGAVPWKDMESKLVNSYPIIGTFIIIHHQHAIATTAQYPIIRTFIIIHHQHAIATTALSGSLGKQPIDCSTWPTWQQKNAGEGALLLCFDR